MELWATADITTLNPPNPSSVMFPASKSSFLAARKKQKGYYCLVYAIPTPLSFLNPSGYIVCLSVEEVPEHDYMLPLSEAAVVRRGCDITLVGSTLKKDGISCELIDLKTLIPWDKEAVEASVRETGRLLISHEAPVTAGFGAEISASIVERCFLRLEAPVARICGLDTPFPLVFEPFYLPNKNKILDAIKSTVTY